MTGLYVRVIAIGLGLLVIFIAMNRCTNAADKRGYERARAEYTAQVVAANNKQAALDLAARKNFQSKEAQWIGERNALQKEVAAIIGRTPAVRLCKPATTDNRQLPGTPSTTGSAGGTDQPAVDGVSVGPDIAPALALYAGECESYRRRLIELQSRWPQ